jgi:membrane-associated protease RseP (regulator of RpoE activity)
MPASRPDSSDSPPPSATPFSEGPPAKPATGAPARAWRIHAWLFLATVVSVFETYDQLVGGDANERAGVIHAAQFTGALLTILLAHEFGHFIAARIHKVDASLPYFIPVPFISPFGTMGAVIRMRSDIPTRRALLDIGAAGPLAGLAFAIPIYVWGLAHSQVVPVGSLEGGVELGDSIFLHLLDHAFGPHVPDGMVVLLSPFLYAGWAGMFVTMINLVPCSQLDGGHVAYALFGPRQDRIAGWVHRSMLAFFFVSLASFVARDFRAGLGLWHLGRHVQNSLFWLVSFEVLAVLGSLTAASKRRAIDPAGERLGVPTRAFATLGLVLLAAILGERSSALGWTAWFAGLAVLLTMEAKWGVLRPSNTMLDHPPTSAVPLDRVRLAVAVVTLAFFVLLFMPTPFIL